MQKWFLQTTTGLKSDEYTDYDKAVADADEKAYLGYYVADEKGDFKYGKYNMTVLNILAFAKRNADYMREHEWKYGDASLNPYLTKEEKIVSCDRFVGWVLGDAGYTQWQPSVKGLPLFGHKLDGIEGSIETFLKLHGFQRIEKVEDVKAGDVIFVGHARKEVLLSEEMREYPSHTYILAGDYTAIEEPVYRYDSGSDARIQSVQPSSEVICVPEKTFRFAYRAPVKS